VRKQATCLNASGGTVEAARGKGKEEDDDDDEENPETYQIRGGDSSHHPRPAGSQERKMFISTAGPRVVLYGPDGQAFALYYRDAQDPCGYAMASSNEFDIWGALRPRHQQNHQQHSVVSDEPWFPKPDEHFVVRRPAPPCLSPPVFFVPSLLGACWEIAVWLTGMEADGGSPRTMSLRRECLAIRTEARPRCAFCIA